MSHSSNFTIPPLARPPRQSSASLIVTPAARIWQRYAAAGGLSGLLLSVAGFLGSHEGEPLAQGAWQPAVLSAIFSGALAGLLMGTVGVLTWALFLSHRRLAPHARVASALTGCVVLVTYLLLRGAGEAFRLVNDAPFNLGTWEFVVGGFGHLAFPLLVEYSLVSMSVLGLAFSSGYGAFVFLRRSTNESPARLALLLRGSASLGGLLFLLHALSSPNMAEGGGLSHTADLSLLASVGARNAELEEMKSELLKGKTYIPRGALLSDGKLWEKAVPRLQGPRPNVLLIMLESVGVGHLGYEGYSRQVTPSIDALAKKSVRFRQARTTATHSNYAQMAVLSSLFPRRYSGLDTYRRLDYPRVLWHDFLSALGYTTATHSSQDESWQGMIRFQETSTPTEFHHAGNYEGERLRMGSERIVPDEVTATRLIRWIDAQDGAWGAYVNFQSTHFPYKIPQAAEQEFQPVTPTRGKYHYLKYPKSDLPIAINRYDNALSYVDAQIGRIIQHLQERALLDETIVIVTSDHGELFFDHGMVTHGRSLFDGEARVPLLVHYPAQLSSQDRHDLVSTLDVLPTLAELLEVPVHPAFQGQSLLLQSPAESRPVFMNIQGMKSADGVLCGNFKFINNRSARETELYNLELDPNEENNLALKHPAYAEALHELLRSQMNAQMRYYSPDESVTREKFYAPRFATCPSQRGSEEVSWLPDAVAVSAAN